MNLAQYQPLAIRTAKMFALPAGNLNHALLGIVTEYLEYKTSFGSMHRKEELGDLMWYLALASHSLEMRLDQIYEMHRQYIHRPVEECIGAFATHVKRMAIYEKPMDQTMKDLMMMSVAGIVSFIERECRDREFDFGSVLDDNIEKLRARFPDKYTNEAAEARADKGGLDATVS